MSEAPFTKDDLFHGTVDEDIDPSRLSPSLFKAFAEKLVEIRKCGSYVSEYEGYVAYRVAIIRRNDLLERFEFDTTVSSESEGKEYAFLIDDLCEETDCGYVYDENNGCLWSYYLQCAVGFRKKDL